MAAHVARGGEPTIAPLVTALPVNPSIARTIMRPSVNALMVPLPSTSRLHAVKAVPVETKKLAVSTPMCTTVFVTSLFAADAVCREHT